MVLHEWMLPINYHFCLENNVTKDEIIKLAIKSGLVIDDGDSLVTGWVEWADLTPFILKFAELLETEITRRKNDE